MLYLRTGGGLKDDLFELFHLIDEETEAQGHTASQQQGPDKNRRMKAHSMKGHWGWTRAWPSSEQVCTYEKKTVTLGWWWKREFNRPPPCKISFLPENSAPDRRQSQKFSLITDSKVMEKTFKSTQNALASNNSIKYTQYGYYFWHKLILHFPMKNVSGIEDILILC